MVRDTAQTVDELPKLSVRDRLTYWEEPNLLSSPYLNQPVHRMIENRAQLTPDETAYFCQDRAVTYWQLMQRARLICPVKPAGKI